MPITLGFTLGFIMKAVGPGLVVPAMFKLQKTGLGRDQGAGPATVPGGQAGAQLHGTAGRAMCVQAGATALPVSGPTTP